MNIREQGFLLLTSYLGDPARAPLTVSQLRILAGRARAMKKPPEERTMQAQDLVEIGYNLQMAHRIIRLLDDEELLSKYLRRGQLRDCYPLTRIGERYPSSVRVKLGLDAPGCLWAKGDIRILDIPAVSLVGSRDLFSRNRVFAEEAGKQAARQGYVLVSGNARGADRAAQQACLEHGGRVVSVVADELEKYPLQRNLLFLSEGGFDEAFSAQRALSRNRIIHCLGDITLVAQSHCGYGGTWGGTVKNLRNGWSPVFCCDDGSSALKRLRGYGACPIQTEQLSDIGGLITQGSCYREDSW